MFSKIKKQLFLFLFLSTSIYAEDDVKKVIIDLTTDNYSTLERRVLKGIVSQKEYFDAKLEKLDVAVVIHGGAYKFFLDDLSNTPYSNDKELLKKKDELKQRIKSLHNTYDVNFIICASGAKTNKLQQDKFYNFVTFSPSAAITLIEKQSDHYAYLPIY